MDLTASGPKQYGSKVQIPVRLQDLVVLAIDRQGNDVTRKVRFGTPVLTWSYPVTGSSSSVRVVNGRAVVQPSVTAPKVIGTRIGVVRQWGPCPVGQALCAPSS